MDDLKRLLRQWGVLIAACVLAIVVVVFAYRFARELNAMAAEFELDTGPQASLLYDRAGQLVFSFHEEERTDRRLSDLAPSVVPAVLSAEDQHFRSHAGIDIVRMGGAAWKDVKTGRLGQGASTITQQLVRLQALGRERTWSRKWHEIMLALRVERRFSKDQILETYLNRIYLGDGYFGVEAAARGYFDKDASALDESEAAMLAGIIRCPSSCSPRTKPEKARSRRDAVLRTMLQKGLLPRATFAAAIAAAPTIKDKRGDSVLPEHHDENDAAGLYFIDAVRRQLTAQFGESAVLRGGLRVYTTLNVAMQKAAEEAITQRLQELDAQEAASRRRSRHPDADPNDNVIEGSLVAIDPRSGEVLALVGGRDFHQSPFNRAIQALRQPGSAFKPIVFAAALERGYAPSSMLDHLDTPIAAAEGPWLPADSHEADSYTLRQALIVSSNRAAVQLLQHVGTPTAQYYARQLGITQPMSSLPSLALGTTDVSLIDLTSAYGVFANNGQLAPHTLISRVEDASGDLLWQPAQRALPAVSPDTAFLMSSMLADVLDRGTGSGARARGFKLPAGGKTGTTNDFADAWFIGYTPKLVAGVWFGRDQPAPIASQGMAATVAVPAWAAFMKQATADDKPEWFPVPSDLEKAPVCQASGMRATPECRLAAANRETVVVDDYFPLGTAPKEPCTLHTVQLNGIEPTSDQIQGLPTTQPVPRLPAPPPSERPLSEPMEGFVVKPRMTTP
jgi:penicillin-binding protein 1A